MQQSCRMFLPNKNCLLYRQNRFWKLHHQICYCTNQSIMTKIIISILLNVSEAWKIDWARRANVMETHLVFLNISLNRSECPKIVCLATSSDILTVCGIYHQGTTCKFSLALGTLSLLSVSYHRFCFESGAIWPLYFSFLVHDRMNLKRADSKKLLIWKAPIQMEMRWKEGMADSRFLQSPCRELGLQHPGILPWTKPKKLVLEK